MSTLAIAALSARSLAEAAAREGHEVIALDLFGDADTRRVARQWRPIGQAGSLRIDPARLLDGLDHAAGQPGIVGWIAGSGFDGEAALLAQAAERLPLLGTQPKAWAAVRDPARFFAGLAADGVAHPPTQMEPPGDPAGWLHKDLHGSGGWQVRSATAGRQWPDGGAGYFQRAVDGEPMSATFIANGLDAGVLGLNRQRFVAFGTRPFVFRGVVGPVRVAPAVALEVGDAVRAVTRRFGLRGLGSLDFMLTDGGPLVLEVNPRPPASLALYPRCGEIGLVEAHLRGCRGEPIDGAGGTFDGRVRGLDIVFARRALTVSAAGAERLSRASHVHDLPAAGLRVAAGDPLCTVGAAGGDAAAVASQLDLRHRDILDILETTP